MKHTTAICLVALIILAGCGGDHSELERIEEVRNEILKLRNVDLSRKLSIDDAVIVKDENKLREIADSFMEKFSTGDTSAAFEGIHKFSPTPQEEFEAFQKQTTRQIDRVRPRYGAFIGYEFVEARRPSASVSTLLYLAKCEIHALRCRFIFYKPKDKWVLDGFMWDDNLKSLE